MMTVSSPRARATSPAPTKADAGKARPDPCQFLLVFAAIGRPSHATCAEGRAAALATTVNAIRGRASSKPRRDDRGDRRALDHEQPETEAVGLRRVQAVEGVKHDASLSGGMPTPVSCTSMRNSVPRCRHPMRTRPRRWVYFRALRVRLRRIPSSRSSSLMRAACVGTISSRTSFRSANSVLLSRSRAAKIGPSAPRRPLMPALRPCRRRALTEAIRAARSAG